MLTRLKAQMLLDECTGDDIWSVELCTQKGIPPTWIDELTDAYESGFNSDSETIYYGDKIVNQFEGIRDVDLAIRLADHLGADVQRVLSAAFSRAAVVRALREAVEEG
ncbi:MAG: hypothetical protein KDB27_32005 [Planctomycetales bacterium]|nr:hypothetical protein [Planctomycetales bacterium]